MRTMSGGYFPLFMSYETAVAEAQRQLNELIKKKEEELDRINYRTGESLVRGYNPTNEQTKQRKEFQKLMIDNKHDPEIDRAQKFLDAAINSNLPLRGPGLKPKAEGGSAAEGGGGSSKPFKSVEDMIDDMYKSSLPRDPLYYPLADALTEQIRLMDLEDAARSAKNAARSAKNPPRKTIQETKVTLPTRKSEPDAIDVFLQMPGAQAARPTSIQETKVTLPTRKSEPDAIDVFLQMQGAQAARPTSIRETKVTLPTRTTKK
jgi:hypothetical protein